jgi:protein gp37
MGEKTAISWTHHTFNPWWGCSRVSEGCRHCYAADLATRLGHDVWGQRPRRFFGEKHWAEPLKWQREAQQAGERRRVFCASMADVFEERPELENERWRLWELIDRTPALDWLLLTKRADRIADLLPLRDAANIWVGTSVEDLSQAWRVECLRSIPAVVRFLSYEPALGPLDDLDLQGIDWLIFGGESGPNFRPANLDWARTMRERCRAQSIAFFFKQSAHRFTERGTTLDGQTLQAFPRPRLATA